MPSIDIYMNLLWLPVIAVISGIIGFAFRSAQLNSAKKKIIGLENEMLQNHAEILSLQKNIANLQQAAINSKTPVVNIKENSGEEKGSIKNKAN